MKNKRTQKKKVEQNSKLSDTVRWGHNSVRDCLDHLAVCVHAVRRHRQMDASETPETQSAWERLNLAVLEAEQVLAATKQIPLDKPARKKHTVSHLPIRMAHGSSARNAGR